MVFPQPGQRVTAGESPDALMNERSAGAAVAGPGAFERSDRTILLVILAVSALLRLPGIWQFEVWQDEIYSIYEARDLIHSPFGPGGMELRPLYLLALHPLTMMAPRAIVLLRLPSLIFGLLGIAATWSLAYRNLGRNAALVAAGVLAVLPLHINASQIIRYWSLIYLLGALYAGALLRALASDRRRDHLMVLLWLLLGTLTHPTFAITAVGMTLAAHLVRNDGGFGWRWPTSGAWRLTWVPAVVLLLLFYAGLWLFFTTERLVGEAAGSPERLVPALAFNLSPALVTASALGVLCLVTRRDAITRRFGLMGTLGALVSVVTLFVGGTLRFLPVSVLYVSAAFPLLVSAAGALPSCFATTAPARRRAAVALLLVLVAGLAPSTVSHLNDGSRFDYRPALGRVQAVDPGGTVVLWPLVQATWAAPGLKGVELRSSTTVSLFDSLLAARDRYWVITSRRRYGLIGDADGRKQQWLSRHCDRILTTARPRYDFEEYVAMLWECRAGGPSSIKAAQPGQDARPLPDRD
ncbi:MAG: hypothetical protein H6Q77_814 [Gemmatimonadetes bacterium]|nr:hypothetical protein [Gemmatimonadota bacterium]